MRVALQYLFVLRDRRWLMRNVISAGRKTWMIADTKMKSNDRRGKLCNAGLSSRLSRVLLELLFLLHWTLSVGSSTYLNHERAVSVPNELDFAIRYSGDKLSTRKRKDILDMDSTLQGFDLYCGKYVVSKSLLVLAKNK